MKLTELLKLKKRHYMVGIVILIGIVLLWYVYNNRYEYLELFSNMIPILGAYECIASNKKIINFIKNMNVVLDKYKVITGEIEASIKFSETEINAGRIVAFVPIEYIKQYPDLKKECYDIANIPNEVRINLDSYLAKNSYQKAQLLFGIDEGEGSNRAYLNTMKNDKVELIGYNVDSEQIAKKVYQQLQFMDFKEKCKKFIGNDIYIQLLDVFPVQTWKIVGYKKDSRMPGVPCSSFYINFNFEYKLAQFDEKLFTLLGMIYKGSREELNKFYECYKDMNVTWISIGKNEENEMTFTMYFVYNRNIRNVIDANKITLLRQHYMKIKKEMEKKSINIQLI
jgi:hypothetical protein